MPVYYAIRNHADVPLLPDRRPAELRDDPDLWSIASVWKLARSENRGFMRSSRCYTWPASDFMPLRILLDGDFALQPVPYFPNDLVGEPPHRVPRLL